MKRQATHPYGDDLAFIHDAGFGGFARSAAPALLGMLERRGIRDGLVIDLGCGSGIWAAELTRSGYQVLGVDYSQPMLRMARRRAPRAKFVHGSFLEVALPPCAAVTSLGECLCYLFDEQNGPAALERLFYTVFEALLPGGLLIFDALAPGYGRWLDRRRYFEGPGWATLVEVEEDPRRRTFTRLITTFRQVGRLYRRGSEVHRLKTYPRQELTAMLRSIGFRVSILSGYGELKFRKGHVGYFARKPAE